MHRAIPDRWLSARDRAMDRIPAVPQAMSYPSVICRTTTVAAFQWDLHTAYRRQRIPVCQVVRTNVPFQFQTDFYFFDKNGLVYTGLHSGMSFVTTATLRLAVNFVPSPDRKEAVGFLYKFREKTDT